MTNTKSALERVILELDSWCDNWTPTSYNDPRISLRQIADRARDVLPQEKMTEYQPTPQTPEQVADGLRNAMKQAKKDGVFDTTTLYDIIADWWDEIFLNNNEAGENIESLVDRIEREWLPPEHDTNSYKWNQCIRLMKQKLR